ncbi:type VII secretion integral membrane protein EccD [Symbioplanes lichenis]|uniref:type VII secretion integral membrane protein EccD n=1 Tax=Symbioplanes lichenis TaxID=1629072 RepID=UPI0027389E29|nr:type VII secretion integral membrane protein EccD [Actinoplanes lichenis]
MVTQAGTGLARIALMAPKRRIDLALPEHLPLVGLLPAVLRQSDEEPTDGTGHGGWALRRADGTMLDLARTLAAQNVRDGEMVHLVPRRAEWPELMYDDLTEAVAAGARLRGRAWTPGATRLTGLVAAVILLALGLVAILSAASLGWIGGAAALVVAVVLLGAGVLLARAVGDSVAGAVVAGLGLPYALVGGAMVLSYGEPLTEYGAPHVLLCSVTLLAAGVLGMLGVGDGSRVFVAAIWSGLLGAIAGGLAYGPLDAPGAAAVVVALCVLLLPAMPALAVRMGKMPMPVLPRTPADLVRDDDQPARERVYQATARADEVLTGMIFGAAVVSIAALYALTRANTVATLILSGVVTLACLLRARLVPTVRHRIPLLCTGFAGIILLSLYALSDSLWRVAVLVPVVLIAGAFAIGAGRTYSRRQPSPRLARLGDVADIVLQLAVVPVACSVLGLYAFMRGLGG